MMRLAEYRSKVSLLADFLPWAALVGEGVSAGSYAEIEIKGGKNVTVGYR